MRIDVVDSGHCVTTGADCSKNYIEIGEYLHIFFETITRFQPVPIVTGLH